MVAAYQAPPGGAAPVGAGQVARGTGSPPRRVFRAYGLRARGWQPPTVRAHYLGGLQVVPSGWSLPMERLQVMAAPKVASYGVTAGGMQCPTARAHGLQGRGTLPSRWFLPTECLRGDGNPQLRGPTARWIGSPAQSVVVAYGVPAGGRAAPHGAGPRARGRGVLTFWWSLPMERWRGDGRPQWRGPAG